MLFWSIYFLTMLLYMSYMRDNPVSVLLLLTSLRMIFFRLIHVPTICISSFLRAKQHSIVYHRFFTQSFVLGHLDCLQNLICEKCCNEHRCENVFCEQFLIPWRSYRKWNYWVIQKFNSSFQMIIYIIFQKDQNG